MNLESAASRKHICLQKTENPLFDLFMVDVCFYVLTPSKKACFKPINSWKIMNPLWFGSSQQYF